MNSRFKQFRHSIGMTQGGLAKALGYSSGHVIKKIENGNADPSAHMIQTLKKEYGLNPIWLTTGEGDMFIPQLYLKDANQVIIEVLDAWIEAIQRVKMRYR